MTKRGICNDSEALNDLLIERGLIPVSDKLKVNYFGKLVINFNNGNIVDLDKQEKIKVN